jgi:hypothetical protein
MIGGQTQRKGELASGIAPFPRSIQDPKKKTMLRIGWRGDTPPQNGSCIGTLVPIWEPSENRASRVPRFL